MIPICSFSIVIGNRTSPLLRLMEYSHMYVFIILVTNLSTLVNHSHAVLLLNVLNFHHADCLWSTVTPSHCVVFVPPLQASWRRPPCHTSTNRWGKLPSTAACSLELEERAVDQEVPYTYGDETLENLPTENSIYHHQAHILLINDSFSTPTTSSMCYISSNTFKTCLHEPSWLNKQVIRVFI